MGPDEILRHVRPLVISVDGAGVVSEAWGGAGDFVGYRANDFLGRTVLDFVSADEREAIASYFIRMGGQPIDAAAFPMPFRTSIVGADGSDHDVDVIPTTVVRDDGSRGWVIVIVPLSLESSVASALNAELAGASRGEVRQRLCEELGYENTTGRWRWFYVAIDGSREVVHAPRTEGDVGAALQRAVDAGWRPWSTWRPSAGEGAADDIDDVDPVTLGLAAILTTCDPPADVAAVGRGDAPPGHELGLSWVPVDLEGDLVGVYLEARWVPPTVPAPLRANAAARVDHLLDVTRLLAERWRDRDRLELAATRDSLTGLANRDVLNDAVRSARTPSAILYIDVDQFKSVNDQWGHAAGDRLLGLLARRIESACRPYDLVARYGGDEFVVLLVEVDLDEATSIGQRVVESVGAPLELTAGPARVSVSVGVAAFTGDNDPVDDADRAMLRAKREGRDRVVIA
jgi:diguanylate cyclase (GGDEF)-like protein